MNTLLAANIISMCVAVGTIGAVVVALVVIWLNRKQEHEDWNHAQELAKDERDHTQLMAQEERQHQARPILAPIDERFFYGPNGSIDWQPYRGTSFQQAIGDGAMRTHVLPANQGTEPSTQKITLRNMGNGPAFNIHIILYGPDSSSYTSWHNGPIAGGGSLEIVADHGITSLEEKTTVDGAYLLYNPSDPDYRLARLTMTYYDLFDILHASIFDYLLLPSREYRWMHLSTKSGIKKDLEDLECEKAPNTRRIKPTL